MTTHITRVEGTDIAIVESPEIIIQDVQDALDLLATVQYQHGCSMAIIAASNLPEDFFRLRTGFAGEILQKFTTYGFRIAIVGDFGLYDSKSLRDFIYESNRGRHVYFATNRREAIAFLQSPPTA